MRLKTLFASSLIVLSLSASLAKAATATATFQVSATVNNACSLSASNINFGTYNALLGTPIDTTGGVAVTCTLGTAFQIGLNAGTGTGATVTSRKLTSGSNVMSYGLYRDIANSQNWGNTPNTDTTGGIGTGLPVNYPVYAALPASQSVPSGTYSDTVTVTVTY